MKLKRLTIALSGKLFWSSLLISATLVADVNQWVPEDLVARAEKEYDYSAGRRIEDWRRMMERVANYPEDRKLEEVNYFFNKHKTKVQMTYRMAENFAGVAGEDVNTGFVQFQFVF